MQLPERSPLSSPPLSDSEDEVNSSSARVYFGPILSPEKQKLNPLSAREILHPQHVHSPGPSSTRRSPRFSVINSRVDDEEQEVDAHDCLETTPIQSTGGTTPRDLMQEDEPPSALARRIMRAADNPSPPPKAIRPRSSFTSSGLINELTFPLIGSSTETTPPPDEGCLYDSEIEVNVDSDQPHSRPETMSSLPSLTLREPSPSPDIAQPQPTSQMDLISFDQSIDVPESLHERSMSQPYNQTTETDDSLLCASPSPRASGSCDYRCSPSPLSNGLNLTDISYLTIQDTTSVPSTPPQRRSPRLSVSPGPSSVQHLTTDATADSRHLLSPQSHALKRKRHGSTEERRTPDKGRTPSPGICGESQDGAPFQPAESERTSPRKRRDRKRVRLDEGGAESEMQAQAQSLSPESAQVLSTLMTPSRLPSNDIIVEEAFTAQNQDLPNHLAQESILLSPSRASSVQRPPPGSSTNAFAITPIGATPVPFLRFKPLMGVDDPARTPARRIPISESPLRPAFKFSVAPTRRPAAGVRGTPVFTRQALDDPNRSPAKRIPITEAMTGVRSGKFSAKTLTGLAPARTRSRSASAEPPTLTVGPNGLFRPPPVTRADPPTAAPLVETSSIKPDDGAGSSAPLAGPSRLKSASPSGDRDPSPQPSATTATQPEAKPVSEHDPQPPLASKESKIPRIGAMVTSTRHLSKLPVPPTRKTFDFSVQPTLLPSPVKVPSGPRRRPIPKGNSSASGSSGSDDSTAGAGASTAASRLKRKRAVENLASSQRAVIPIRPVVPAMFGPSKSTVKAGSQASVGGQNRSLSPVRKAQQPVIMRKFVKAQPQGGDTDPVAGDGTRSVSPGKAASEIHADDRMQVDGENTADPEHAPLDDAQPGASSSPSGDVDHAHKVDTLNHPGLQVNGEAGAAAPPVQSSRSSRLEARRTPRPQKPPSDHDDIFGPVAAASSSAPTSRRKPANGVKRSNTDTLPTSALALKNLTTTNTTRNQHYYTSLETRIVKKAGDRPESPSMKLRTVLQKQKEEQGKERAERAKRRRGDGEDVSDFSMDVDGCGGENGRPTKHARGAGDDEDYESPVRGEQCGKRVKWDRGLVTTMYLDEIDVRTNGRHRDAAFAEASRRSCFAKDAKGISLDNFGNLVNVDSPLELIAEKVIVTKYVYDNDEEPEAVVVKQTRSKTKKGR